ncbi:hypothetical protein P9A06_25565 [Serratia marcescens]|uniref:hypothetical protein n=1 Tax=Serratia marcescens TaxID=615 RepID=UPI003204ABD7
MDNKLSELSKPVAWIIGEESIEEFKRGYETFVVRGDDVDSTEETMKLYSQEYVSALQHESAVNWEASASINVENQELKKRIAELEGQLQSGFTPEALAQEERAENAEQRVAELEAKTAMTMGVGSGNGNLFVHGDYDSIKAAQAIVLENESLRAKLATPVRLPRRAPENLASVLDGYEKWLIATTFRDTWNACLDEVSRVSSGFTVEGDE